MPLWLFIFLGALAIIAAFGVILQRSPVHCLLALAFALVDIGALFIGLGAVTVGFLQIIIYVGAIMILFLFVIWLLNLQADTGFGGHLALKFCGAIAAAALVAELFVMFLSVPATTDSLRAVPSGYGSIESLARVLFSDYLIAFEVTSLLLLAAVVGSVALARRMPSLSRTERVTSEASANVRSARL
jgi:NADH-quinone oxidoreductase subunit J